MTTAQYPASCNTFTIIHAAHEASTVALLDTRLYLHREHIPTSRSKVAAEAAPTKPGKALTGFGSGISFQDTSPMPRGVVDFDSVTPPEELKKVRKTKIVCTIGPTSCSKENLYRLADEVCVWSWCYESCFLICMHTGQAS